MSEELSSAVLEGDLDLTRALLESLNDADIRTWMDTGRRTLLYSSCRGYNANPEVVRALLHAGACPQQPSTWVGSYPQHALVQNYAEALRCNRVHDSFVERLSDIVRCLRDFQVDFSRKNTRGQSALADLEEALRMWGARSNEFEDLFFAKEVLPLAWWPKYGSLSAERKTVFDRCCEHIRQQNGFPRAINQSLRDYMFEPVPDERGFIVNIEATALAKFCPRTRAIRFDPSNMQIWLDTDPEQVIEIRICMWPESCLLRESPATSGPAPRLVLVDWQWDFQGHWHKITDPDLLKQLLRRDYDIKIPPHRYKLGDDFTLRGDGPYDAVALRWLPSTGTDSDEVESCEDDEEDDDEYLLPPAEEGAAQAKAGDATAWDDIDPLGCTLPSEDPSLHVPAAQAEAVLTPEDIADAVLAPDSAMEAVLASDHVAEAALVPEHAPETERAPERVTLHDTSPDDFPGEHRHLLDALCGMGFDEASAREALVASNFTSVELALDHMCRSPKASEASVDVPAAARLEAPKAAMAGAAVAGAALAGAAVAANRTRPQTIDFAPVGPKWLGDPDFSLYAMATSGLPVTFESSNPSVARIRHGNRVSLVGEGKVALTAKQDGNDSFLPAPVVMQELNVTKKFKLSITLAPSTLSAANTKFLTSLPKLLRLRNFEDFTWNQRNTCISCTGSPEQMRALQTYIQAYNQVLERIVETRMRIKSTWAQKLRSAMHMVKTQSPPLLPEDPVRNMCAEFLRFMREMWEKREDQAIDRYDELVQGHSEILMELILVFPLQVSTEATGQLESLSRKHSLDTISERSMTLEILFKFLDAKVSEMTLQGAQLRAFQGFYAGLKRRAESHLELSIILRDFSIHSCCARRNLSFYSEAAQNLLEVVHRSDVSVVRTATGSGKSTLMPLLLLAAGLGYNRIAVTQPRRFAAESIQAKIEEIHGPTICGFCMAGKSKNPRAHIVYITDGLLRAQLTAQHSRDYDVIIIDEVHERSMEIDTCVALLAMRRISGLRMPKVILSSATFDEQVLEPFKQGSVPCSVGSLEQQVINPHKTIEHYPDKRCFAPGCQICSSLARSRHAIEIVLQLHLELTGQEQLLCFLPSQKEVMDAVDRLNERNINAKPLYAQQNGAKQLEYLRTARVFFSTNIAETSLTFPSLKFVVDCGLVQRPRFEGGLAIMETLPAAVSTLKQRKGRVGRTMDGHYVALYNFATYDTRPKDIVPKMKLEVKSDIVFSLECQLRRSVDIFFPSEGQAITLKKHNDAYYRFPVLGGAYMADAFYAAQTQYHCGDDILLFAAMRMSFQTKILQKFAFESKSIITPNSGDISIVIGALRRLDSSLAGKPLQAITRNVVAWCNSNGLSEFWSPLTRALKRYNKMKKHYLLPSVTLPHNQMHPIFARVAKTNFDGCGQKWNGFAFGRKCEDGSPDMRCGENFDSYNSLRKSADFTQVIKALSTGFKTNFFVHFECLDGPKNYYSRATDFGDGGDNVNTKMKTIYSFHTKSTLSKSKPAPQLVFAMECMLFGTEMPENEVPCRFGAIQMAERLSSFDDIPQTLFGERYILLHQDDSVTPSHSTTTKNGQRYCVIKGPLGQVLDKEINLRKVLRIERNVPVLESTADPLLAAQVKANVETLSKDKRIFSPLKWHWSNSYGSKVEVNLKESSGPHFKIAGRANDVERFTKQLALWKRQLHAAPAVEPDPDEFIAVDLYRRPKKLGSGDDEFRERLRQLTAPALSEAQIFHMSEGPKASRESRMMLVAWIAIQTFGCKLCGGFVRDWVVGGNVQHLSGSCKDWIDQTTAHVKYEMKEGLLPKDLDLELPLDRYFDVGFFVAEVRRRGVQVDHHEHIAQRHVFLFERDRGPFTADFIEPHFAALHTLADFDVNTLCIVAYPDLIGLKRRYVLNDGSELTVDAVIANCISKSFTTLQPAGSGILALREQKMLHRGWTKLGEKTFIPANPQADYGVIQILSSDPLFVKFRDILDTKVTRAKAKLRAMYEIRSSIVDAHYHAMREEFKRLPGGANEQELFHGTTAVDSILRGGFDDHFWRASGNFGRGAYFADDPNLSAAFTGGSNPRHIFVCSVLLGSVQDESATPLTSAKGADFYPNHGRNSVKGRLVNREMEYIVYRYGQARPRYLLRFDM